MIDLETIRQFLAQIVFHYEHSAPTVSRWADDLYIRLGEDLYAVKMIEVITAQMLQEEGQWAYPQLAANRIYKLMTDMRQDTTGHAGF